MRPALQPLLSAVLIVTAAACGGGGSDGPSTPAPVAVATVNVTFIDNIEAGSTTQATAVALDASGQAVTGRAATWASSATNIATVDATSGLVTARAAGSTTITATVDGRAGSAPLTVRAVAAAVTITMLPQSFVPPFVTIKAGQSVAFDFSGSIDHNVIFRRPLTGVPENILPRRSGIVTRIFPTAGTFPFECTLHNGMIGEVTVTP